MRKSKFLASSSGSAPVELSSLVALLVLPLAPMLVLYGAIFDSIAAESIARHALRAAILSASTQEVNQAIADSVATLSNSWQRSATFTADCGDCERGDFVVLRVQVGNSLAIQVAGLEPK